MQSSLQSLALVLCILFNFQILVSAPEQRPMSADDFVLLKSVRSPQWSPDGKQVVCVVSELDLKRNGGESEIVLISAPNGDRRHLCSGFSPRFSPDGSMLAYLGGEGDSFGNLAV